MIDVSQKFKDRVKDGVTFFGSFGKIYKAVNPLIQETRFINKCLSLVNDVKNIFRTQMMGLPKEPSILDNTKYVSFIGVPFTAFSFARHSCKVVWRIGAGEFAPALKSLLKTAEDVGGLSSSAGSFINLLSEGGCAVANAALVTPILFGVGGLLSGGSLLLNMKSFYSTRRFSKRFEGKTPLRAIELIKAHGDKELKKYFRIGGAELKGRLEQVGRDHEKARKVIKALQTRVTYKNITHAIKILAAAVTVAASIVLLCSPGAPAGLVLLTVAAALSISAVVVNQVATRQMHKELNLLIPNKRKLGEIAA